MVKRSAVALLAHGRQQHHRVSTARTFSTMPDSLLFDCGHLSTLYVKGNAHA
jgi:hypothetical protein